MNLPLPACELALATIEAVRDIVRSEYARSRALIVTGSAARDEGTIAITANGVRWLSDLEFLVVVPDTANIAREVATLDRLALLVSSRLLDTGVRVAVELTPAPERYFGRIRPHLFGYELRTCGRQIYGGEDYLARIPQFAWQEIPKDDGWRLTSNRLVEWLEFLLNGHKLGLPDQFYALCKQYLDLITALSLFSGHYAPGYAARAVNAERVTAWMKNCGVQADLERFLRAATICWEFKADPMSRFQWLWMEAADLRTGLAPKHLEWMYDSLPALLSSVWRWQRSQCGPSSLRERVRGWSKLVLHEPTTLTAMARLFARGTPRALLYECTACTLECHSTRNPGELTKIRRRLPVAAGGAPTDWHQLASACVDIWKTHLRRSGV